MDRAALNIDKGGMFMRQRDQLVRGAAAIVRICRAVNGLLLVAIVGGLIST